MNKISILEAICFLTNYNEETIISWIEKGAVYINGFGVKDKHYYIDFSIKELTIFDDCNNTTILLIYLNTSDYSVEIKRVDNKLFIIKGLK